MGSQRLIVTLVTGLAPESGARSESYAYQLLCGIEDLKAASAEDRAVAHWSGLFAREISVSLRSLRLQFGIVTQESYVFGSSIRDNIALAAPSITQDDVIRAARLACIDEDIQAMTMRYATVLTEGRASLSGCQRQRLVLARALAHRPSVFLLDEATSALYTVTETAVYRNLASLDSTVIVIAHRLSTITRADLIVVITAKARRAVNPR